MDLALKQTRTFKSFCFNHIFWHESYDTQGVGIKWHWEIDIYILLEKNPTIIARMPIVYYLNLSHVYLELYFYHDL